MSDLLKVVTYNTHNACGLDRRSNLSRIAGVLSQTDADIIALQEVDAMRKRTNFAKQACELGEELNQHWLYAPSWVEGSEQYGLALLSRYPLCNLQTVNLPLAKLHREPRILMLANVTLPSGVTVTVGNTHLSLYQRERMAQAKAINERLQDQQQTSPLLLCGDLNAYRRSKTVSLVQAGLGSSPRSCATFPSYAPMRMLDHILYSRHFRCESIRTHKSRLARIASDHLPLVAQLRL